MKYDCFPDFTNELPTGTTLMSQTLNPHIMNSNSIVIYGAGQLGIDALKHLRAFGKEPIAFCDTNDKKTGTKISNIPIIGLRELCRIKKDATIVLTPLHYSFEVEKVLIQMGFENIFLHQDILSTFYNMRGYQSELEEKQFIANANKYKIEFVREKLEDDKSKSVFDSIMRLWLYGDFKEGVLAAKNESYYPAGVIELNNEEVFVDCGAYTGDSIIEFSEKTNKKYRAIYAFEADELSYELAKLTISKQRLDNIFIQNIGIYDKRGVLSFDCSGSIGNRITDSGNTLVHVDTLDNLLKERKYRITYIKMDIEGSEHEALRGAYHIIAQDKPKLAISVYHKYGDIWEIPYYIINNYQGQYRIYLRQNYALCDTV